MPFFTDVAFHSEAVIVSSNAHIEFKACGKYRLILQLELPVCCQGHVAYLVNTFSGFHLLLGI
jgi:hypothetical protein